MDPLALYVETRNGASAPTGLRPLWVRSVLSSMPAFPGPPPRFYVAVHWPQIIRSVLSGQVNSWRTLAQWGLLAVYPLVLPIDPVLATYIRSVHLHYRRSKRNSLIVPVADAFPLHAQYREDFENRLNVFLDRPEIAPALAVTLGKALGPAVLAPGTSGGCAVHGYLRSPEARKQCEACWYQYVNRTEYTYYREAQLIRDLDDNRIIPAPPPDTDTSALRVLRFMNQLTPGTFGMQRDAIQVQIDLKTYLTALETLGWDNAYAKQPLVRPAYLELVAEKLAKDLIRAAPYAMVYVPSSHTLKIPAETFDASLIPTEPKPKPAPPSAPTKRRNRLQTHPCSATPTGTVELGLWKGKIYAVPPFTVFDRTRRVPFMRMGGKRAYHVEGLRGLSMLNADAPKEDLDMLAAWLERHEAEIVDAWDPSYGKNDVLKTRSQLVQEGKRRRLGPWTTKEGDWLRIFLVSRDPGRLTPDEKLRFIEALPLRPMSMIKKQISRLAHDYALCHGYAEFKKSGFYMGRNLAQLRTFAAKGVDFTEDEFKGFE